MELYITKYISNSPLPFARILPRYSQSNLLLICTYVVEDTLILPGLLAVSNLLAVFMVSPNKLYVNLD